MFRALAHHATKRSKRTVAAALLIFIAAALAGSSVADHLDPYEATDPKSESARADAQLERAGVSAGVDVVALVKTPQGAATRSGRARVREIAADLRAEAEVLRVVTFEDGGDSLIADDRRSSYIAAGLRPGADEIAAGERLLGRLGDEPGVRLGGSAIVGPQGNEQVSKDLRRAELLAFPLLFFLSFLFFRSVVAALLPLLVGGMAIVSTMVGLRLAAELTSVSLFALNLVILLGLGLAIDYSLFIVSRYREELARSGASAQAIRRTLATAGRTVLFSSLTVAAALSALLVFPQRFLYSMGIGGVLVALLAGAVALLVLPAVLALLGPRVNALAPRRLQRAADADARPASVGAWYRLSRAVMRRPVGIASAGAALLIALGIPFLGANFTAVDAGVLPDSTSARQVDEALERDFDRTRTTPITLVAQTSPGPALDRYLLTVHRVDGVADVSAARRAPGGLMLVDVAPAADALGKESQQAVRDIRSLDPPFTVLSRGQSAAFVDLKDSLADHLPAALLLLAGATVIVLFLMTGSLVLPVKALLMNLLTVSAALGLLVLIFQDGRLEGLLAYTSDGALDATQPIFLAAVAFGLSTDYGVFLLSRIKEARDGGVPDAEAVAVGLERTGRVVTAAALLFFVAIGASATSEVVFIKQLGVGTALAVLIDATIVRALLVPSLMRLLGERNWWAPRPLRQLHGRIGLREAHPAEA